MSYTLFSFKYTWRKDIYISNLPVKIENFVSYIFLNKITELTVVLCEYYLNCAYAALAACYIKIKVKKNSQTKLKLKTRNKLGTFTANRFPTDALTIYLVLFYAKSFAIPIQAAFPLLSGFPYQRLPQTPNVISSKTFELKIVQTEAKYQRHARAFDSVGKCRKNGKWDKLRMLCVCVCLYVCV